MSFVIIIPARFASTRLPGKPLVDIRGKPLIVHVLERVREVGAERIIIATDHDDIAQTVKIAGGEVCMTSPNHQSGTERLAEVVKKSSLSNESLIINVQCDGPIVPKETLQKLIDDLSRPEISMSTLAVPILHIEEVANPNTVKVVVDIEGNALYFSRAPIPWDRNHFFNSEKLIGSSFLRHLGIYGYRAEFILRYSSWEPSPLENIEMLEQLRVLWYGEKIHVIVTKEVKGIEINTPEDLECIRTKFF